MPTRSGELINAGFPVPPGFVPTASVYLGAMAGAGVREELASLHRSALAAVDRPAEPEDLCARAAATVRAAAAPAELAAAVQEAYAGLADSTDDGMDPIVAVRSSAVGEDAADTSFAGMNATFTDVRGLEDLLGRIVDCWARAWR